MVTQNESDPNAMKYFLKDQNNYVICKFSMWQELVILLLKSSHQQPTLKGGDSRVRIFSAHNNWWATPEVILPLPYQRSAKIFLNFLRQGVKTVYYCKNMHSKSLKCAK